MHIRCPHCYNPIQLVADQTLTDIECPSCGSHFQLLSEGSTKTYRYEPATQIGQFELIEVVGTGRYGAVWKARDTQLDRTVAIKIPRAETLSASESEQFLREARAAAQVKHSNIVSVLEVGRHEETLYIVSDFIDGVNLRQWLSQNRLSPKEAARLTATIAGALHQAHEAGVVHRDLKPSNIMIDHRGEPFVADFGLAKREAGEITITMDGRVLGTPAYMPPEQASGHGHNADRRADVYALGVMLFEMLTGETPFRGEQRMLIMQILYDDPPGPRQLNSRVPRDLNTICLKCLEKKPEARYQTAAELSDDLNRFLRGEPILARPLSTLSRTARWCRRNPTIAALLSLVFLTLATGAGVSSYFAWQSHRQAAQLSTALYESLLSQIKVTREAGVQGYREIVEDLAAEARRLDTPAYDRAELRHEVVAAMGDFVGYAPTAFEDFPSEVTCVALDPEGAHLATGHKEGELELRSLDESSSRELGGFGDAEVRWLQFSPDGNRLTSADAEGMVRQWDLTSDSIEPQLSWQISMPEPRYGKSADRQLLVAIAPEQIDIWNLAEMRRTRSIAAPGLTIRTAALSVRGDILAAGYSESGGDSSGLVAWNVETGEQLMKSAMELGSTYQNAIDFSEYGRYLGIGFDRALLVYDAADLTQLAVRRWDATKAVAFHPRSPYLAAVDIRGRVMLWDPLTGQEIALLHNWRGTVSRESLAFDGDGSMLVSSNANRVHVWDLEAADERRTLAAHQGGVPCLAFSHDGAWLASGGKDRFVRFWDARTGTHRGQFGVRGPVQTITFSPDDQLLAIGYWGDGGEGVEILDFDTRKTLASLQPKLGRINCLKLFESSGEQYLAGAGEKGFALWSVTADNEQQSVRLSEIERQKVDRCLYLAVSPDGRWVVYTSKDRDLNVFDVSQRKPHSISAPAINQGWHGLDFFPDNKRFIYVSQQGTADAWDVVTDKATLTLGSSGEFDAPHLALSPTGKFFAGLSGSDAVSIWDTLRQEKLFTLQPDGNAVWSLAWSPDERQLAVGFTDGRVALWDLDEVRQELRKLGLAW